MAVTKKQKVEFKIMAHCHENNITLYPIDNSLEECWQKVPLSLVKKLNSDELFEYIRLHILPGMLTPPLKGMYQDNFRIGHRAREYYA